MGATGLQVSATFLLVSVSLFMVINSDSHFNVSPHENEVDDESSFSYGGNETGPEHWGNLNPQWEKCESGRFQSPIDLLDERVELSSVRDLKRAYKPAPAVIKNRGHDIMVQWRGDAGNLIINGTHYKLLQCHWHTPSEHFIDGHSFNMELHMVHNSSEGQIAVVGILYELGRPNRFISKLLHHMKSLGEEEKSLGVVNPWKIRFGSGEYYRYVGSLTVPPCTEGVLWTVLKRTRTASTEQLRELRDAVHDGFANNARPVQDLNGRSVNLYHPEL